MLRKILDKFPIYAIVVENHYRFVVIYTTRFRFKANRNLKKLKDSGRTEVKIIKL